MKFKEWIKEKFKDVNWKQELVNLLGRFVAGLCVAFIYWKFIINQ